jgi:hypothetical protein
MSEWQHALAEALEPGLVAHSEDGRETQARLEFDNKSGAVRIEWEDDHNQRWHLTIPHAVLVALTNAIMERLYPVRRKRTHRDGAARGDAQRDGELPARETEEP